MTVPKIMKGRAEYEDISNKTLFESSLCDGLSVRDDKYNNRMEVDLAKTFFYIKDKCTGMIVGDRGSGKTFFIKKLADLIPTKIYDLDKESLEYKVLQPSCIESPKLIAVDDLHYLMQAMKLNRLQGKPANEDSILKRLYDFKHEAEAANAALFFVSDHGPAGLYSRFENKDNQKKFLELLAGCAVSPDDSHVFYQQLGKYYCNYAAKSDSRSILKLRSNIDSELACSIRKEFGMLDIPLIVPDVFLSKSLNSNYEKKIYSVCGICLGPEPFRPERWSKEYIEMEQLKIPGSMYIKHAGNDFRNFGYNVLIRPIRELKVLNDELGVVSRNTLGLELGKTMEGRLYYTADEVRQISNVIQKKYSAIAKKTYLPLAKALLSTESDEEIRAYMIEHNLAQD